MLGATVGGVPVGRRAIRAPTMRAPAQSSGIFIPCRGPANWVMTPGSNDGWKGRSGVNVWGWYMTVDEQRGIVYMTFGGPAANYCGGDRPGKICSPIPWSPWTRVTGKYKWHFQTIHHDLWDSDLPPAPSLIDIVKDGKKIPALAQIGKTGWMFILDRINGKPVFGVEERPVPKGDVPGEWYSPTQPFPLKPPPLARVSFSNRRHRHRRRHHARACQSLPGALRERTAVSTMPDPSRRGCFMRTERRPRARSSFPA